MRELAGLLMSLALPWIAGALGVLALTRRQAPAGPYAVGYGYLPGALLVTLLMRALDFAGVRWTVVNVSLPVVACVLVLAWAARRSWRTDRRSALGAPELRHAEPALKALFWACLALVSIRLAGLALEVLWRPLLPWDAWSQWATKARVWYEYGRLAPFVSPSVWFKATDAMRFVDMNSGYPGTVPLLQVWTNLWLGHWDESLMSTPWIAVATAFGFGFYAQLRRAGAAPASAMLFTYLVLSIPFLNIHMAIAGVVDLFVATAYGMAAMSLWQWTRTRERADLVLAAIMAAVCAAAKTEGTLWALTLVPGMVVAINRRVGLWLVAFLAALALLYLALGPNEITLFRYALRTRFTNVSLPLLQHMFVMDNWHLLWYGAVVVLVLRARRLFAPEFAPMTVTMIGALAFVVVVFYFSSASGGVDDETLVNRLPFHMVLALAYYLALLLLEVIPASAAASVAPTPASAAPDA
jgi:hypothetical protein